MTALLAGCGSSHHVSTTTGTTSSTAAALARPESSEILSRFLTSSELTGLTPGPAAVYTTAHAWLSSPPKQSAAQAAAENAMLTREGFRAGGTENFTTAGTSGLSVVEEFRSAASARAALRFYVSRLRAPSSTAGPYVPFKVRGIPGAMVFSLGGGAGINVAFAHGDYYYLVGLGGESPAEIAELNAAARHLYDRERG